MCLFSLSTPNTRISDIRMEQCGAASLHLLSNLSETSWLHLYYEELGKEVDSAITVLVDVSLGALPPQPCTNLRLLTYSVRCMSSLAQPKIRHHLLSYLKQEVKQRHDSVVTPRFVSLFRKIQMTIFTTEETHTRSTLELECRSALAKASVLLVSRISEELADSPFFPQLVGLVAAIMLSSEHDTSLQYFALQTLRHCWRKNMAYITSVGALPALQAVLVAILKRWSIINELPSNHRVSSNLTRSSQVTQACYECHIRSELYHGLFYSKQLKLARIS